MNNCKIFQKLKLNVPIIKIAGEALTLNSTFDNEITFVGTDIAISGQIIHGKDDANIMFSLESNRKQCDVQLIQPLELDLSWKSYIIAPGAMYNGNRFIVSPQPYCPYLLTEGVTPDGPIVMSDVPRLCSDTSYRAEFAANALAIPAVGVYDPERKLGYIIGIEIYGVWGVTGFNLQTLPGKPVCIEICLPVMRKKRYRFCDWIDVDNEPGMDIEQGKPISYKIHILRIETPTIPNFVSALAEYGYMKRGNEIRRPVMSFAEAAKLIENKLNTCNWDETNSFYTESGRFPKSSAGLFTLQTGWVSGGVTFYALAQSQKPEIRKRAIRMMDNICRNALTPSGYFYGIHTGKQWLSFGLKRPGCRSASLIRRPLECTRDVLKTIEFLKHKAEFIDPVWEYAAKSNLDAMVRTTKQFGHLGYTVDFDTGNILWGDSCGGAFGIEPLVRGYCWFGNPEYLKTAEILAEYYVSHFISKGYTCGGAGDALMAVDSESNYALLAGLVYLYEKTHNEELLEWACWTADLFATWVLCYDAKLPSGSTLEKLGIQAQGLVFANIQNQHGAAGICTASGNALLKLYEATGKERYLKLLEDIAQCIPQMIVRPGQEDIWGKLPIGSISERIMTVDGLAPCGETSIISTWAEISMLHVIRELPPVYKNFKNKIIKFEVRT